jgi:hypothetical protein
VKRPAWELDKAHREWTVIAADREKNVLDRIAIVRRAHVLLEQEEARLVADRRAAESAWENEAKAYEEWKAQEEIERGERAGRRAKLLGDPAISAVEEGSVEG